MKGYEYEYRFELVNRDEIQLTYVPHIAPGIQSVVFEVRTKFVVKTAGRPDEVVGSESYNCCMLDHYRQMSVDGFCFVLGFRMLHYGMSPEEIKEMATKAFALMDEEDSVFYNRGIIVNLDVCTLQLEGEEIVDVRDRAISQDNLCALKLCRPLQDMGAGLMEAYIMSFIAELRWTRVEDVEKGLEIMESCGICKGVPKLGAQIVSLPVCKHAFHFHCIIRLLMSFGYRCPSCNEVMSEDIVPP